MKISAEIRILPLLREPPEATRENWLGYSWPPRLYQVLTNLQEAIAASQPRFHAVVRLVWSCL